MKWHCLANNINYCNGEPEWDGEPIKGQGGYILEGKCKLAPETCGHCQTLEEQVDLTVPWLSRPTCIENIILIEKPKVEGEKPKSKKAIKLEAEIAQRSMF